jgi:hypothetical protein
MKDNPKLSWLRAILLIKAVACFFLWGLPALLAPPALFEFLKLVMPKDPEYLRLFGAVVTAAGLLYWFAYKDPVRNVAIIRFAILDNGLGTLTLVVLFLKGKGNWMFNMSAIIAFIVFITLIFLFPKEKPESINKRMVS